MRWLVIVLWLTIGNWVHAQPANQLTVLSWDALVKEQKVHFVEAKAGFAFWVTNISSVPITIRMVHTSCGCTVAHLPKSPWVLIPGEAGKLPVDVLLVAKRGVLYKQVMIDTSVGPVMLSVIVQIIPEEGFLPQDRAKNQILAQANRQAVFQADCARCHSKPTEGKTGPELFTAACRICHEGPTRASMVPDLRNLKKPTDTAYWRQWITQGRPGTLMPAFATTQGGPLSDAQIQSLVDYLKVAIPSNGTSPAKQ